MRLIDADKLKEEINSWGMNDYEPSDFVDAIDEAPTVEPNFGVFKSICCEDCDKNKSPQVTVFCENADEKTVEELKAELERVIDELKRYKEADTRRLQWENSHYHRGGRQ